ncbi:MAG: glycosyltransferase family 2 protein [bacterium]|nr:glycosyltransferase family 2 protein [bacterium]
MALSSSATTAGAIGSQRPAVHRAHTGARLGQEKTCNLSFMSPDYVPGLVSIIIPTYDRPAYVVEALQSAFGQTYRPIELIVVDDGSTDNTAAVIDNWAKTTDGDKGFHFHYVRQEHKGAPAARNMGLRQSRGEYIVLHDSDDILDRNRIRLQVDRMRHTGATLCGARLRFFPSGRGSNVWPQPSSDPLKDFLFGKLPCATQAWMVKRELVIRSDGFDEELACRQDYDFSFRLMSCGPKITFQPEAWTYVREHNGGRITDKVLLPEGFGALLRIHGRRAAVLKERSNRDEYLRVEAEACLACAIQAHLRSYRNFTQEFVRLAKSLVQRPVWGDSWVKRSLFCIGGVSLCSMLKRVREVANTVFARVRLW